MPNFVDDEVLELIRSIAISDVTLKASIGNNFYLRELPQVKVPKYPNMALDISRGELIQHVKAAQVLQIVIWSYSNNSYEEAKDNYNRFFDLAHNQRFSNTEVNIVMRETDRPGQFFQQEQHLFFYRASWIVYGFDRT